MSNISSSSLYNGMPEWTTEKLNGALIYLWKRLTNLEQKMHHNNPKSENFDLLQKIELDVKIKVGFWDFKAKAFRAINLAKVQGTSSFQIAENQMIQLEELIKKLQDCQKRLFPTYL